MPVQLDRFLKCMEALNERITKLERFSENLSATQNAATAVGFRYYDIVASVRQAFNADEISFGRVRIGTMEQRKRGI